MSFDKNVESLYEMMKSQNRDHHIHLKLENGHKIFINSFSVESGSFVLKERELAYFYSEFSCEDLKMVLFPYKDIIIWDSISL